MAARQYQTNYYGKHIMVAMLHCMTKYFNFIVQRYFIHAKCTMHFSIYPILSPKRLHKRCGANKSSFITPSPAESISVATARLPSPPALRLSRPVSTPPSWQHWPLHTPPSWQHWSLHSQPELQPQCVEKLFA